MKTTVETSSSEDQPSIFLFKIYETQQLGAAANGSTSATAVSLPSRVQQLELPAAVPVLTLVRSAA